MQCVAIDRLQVSEEHRLASSTVTARTLHTVRTSGFVIFGPSSPLSRTRNSFVIPISRSSPSIVLWAPHVRYGARTRIVGRVNVL